MKILLVCSIVAAVTLAEPPVDNRYLPPTNSLSAGGPSQTYGVPGLGSGFGSARQTNALFRGSSLSGSRSASRRPSSQYGPPSAQYGAPLNTPSSQYGAPQNTPSSQYGAPGQTPSSVYGAPQNGPSSQYGAPAPSALYGAPQNGGRSGSAPSQQYGAPSQQYGAPSQQYGAPSQQYGAPSQQYGAPGIGGGQYSQGGAGGFRAEQSRQYLPPGAGRGYDDGSNGEPANYNFEYMVKDDESGNDFGHRESRLGDRAEGLYYVLLPDGRKQTVEYEADQEGYKPKISYEDTGAGAYRNGQGYVNGGYNQGPY